MLPSPKYRLTPAAKSDLLDIWNYTVKTWGEKQAENYLLDIESQLIQFAENPNLGRQRPDKQISSVLMICFF